MNTAIILAGGKSSRMGFDKQFIKIGDTTITEHIIKELKPLFKEIIVVTKSCKFYENSKVITVEDIYKGLGPMAGIHAGLIKSSSEYNYVIACDMPFINIEYIKYMMERIKENKGRLDLVMTKTKEMVETLNAFYNKSLIPIIEDMIKEDKKSLHDLLDITNVLYIEEEKAKSFSPDWRMFTNLNKTSDLKCLDL